MQSKCTRPRHVWGAARAAFGLRRSICSHNPIRGCLLGTHVLDPDARKATPPFCATADLWRQATSQKWYQNAKSLQAVALLIIGGSLFYGTRDKGGSVSHATSCSLLPPRAWPLRVRYGLDARRVSLFAARAGRARPGRARVTTGGMPPKISVRFRHPQGDVGPFDADPSWTGAQCRSRLVAEWPRDGPLAAVRGRKG